MGRISKGILGGFSGKVGPVVGGSWKGISYMRSKSEKRGNSRRTPAQHAQQLKFALGIRFLQSMTDLLDVSFRDFAIGMTGINNALSFTLKHAVSGTYPNFGIDYANALVSRGDLPNASAPTVTAAGGGLLKFNWQDNSGTGRAKPGDKAILVAYDPAHNEAIYTTGSAERSLLTDTLNVQSLNGREVETYIGFISADGTNIANSIYTGRVLVS